MTPRWTRAGVRHRGPRWYWVRFDGGGLKALAFKARGSKTLLDMDTYGCWKDWEVVAEARGLERWSEPIREPEEG